MINEELEYKFALIDTLNAFEILPAFNLDLSFEQELIAVFPNEQRAKLIAEILNGEAITDVIDSYEFVLIFISNTYEVHPAFNLDLSSEQELIAVFPNEIQANFVAELLNGQAISNVINSVKDYLKVSKISDTENELALKKRIEESLSQLSDLLET